jgi:RNA polymerase sigma-70 factor, ECF subfamily
MGMPSSPQTVQRLVDEHYVALYRYACRLTGSSADAEDLVQETFCKAQVSLGQLRDPARVKPWLFKILRNEFLHRVQAANQHPCVSLEGVGDLPEPLPESLPDIDPEQLQKALNELPEVYRTPIILFSADRYGDVSTVPRQDAPAHPALAGRRRRLGERTCKEGDQWIVVPPASFSI